jgi:glutamyl-tRNA synthetase
MSEAIINEPKAYDEKAINKFVNENSVDYIDRYVANLKENNNLKSPEDFENFTSDFLEKNSLKLKDIAQLLRIALVGSSVSPSIFDVMSVIKYDEVSKRLINFSKYLNL